MAAAAAAGDVDVDVQVVVDDVVVIIAVAIVASNCPDLKSILYLPIYSISTAKRRVPLHDCVVSPPPVADVASCRLQLAFATCPAAINAPHRGFSQF